MAKQLSDGFHRAALESFQRDNVTHVTLETSTPGVLPGSGWRWVRNGNLQHDHYIDALGRNAVFTRYPDDPDAYEAELQAELTRMSAVPDRIEVAAADLLIVGGRWRRAVPSNWISYDGTPAGIGDPLAPVRGLAQRTYEQTLAAIDDVLAD